MGEPGVEESWSGFIAHASDMFCVAAFDGYFKRLNAAWTATLGWDRDELRSRPWLDFVHPDDRAATEQAGERLGAGAEVLGFDNRYRHKEGHYLWLSWTAHSVPEQKLIYAVARDVTRQKEMEAALLRSREDHRMVFEGMLDGFSLHEMIFDGESNPIDYVFLAVNPAFEAQTGLRAKDIVGRRVLDVLPGTEAHWIQSFGKVAKTGVPMRFENYSREFGKYFECLAFRPKPGQFACTFHDVTARRQVEEQRAHLQAQLLQAQKMESLGRLAGGVAHDFNNLLTVILGNASLLGLSATLEAKERAYLVDIERAGQSAAELAGQLLAFGRKSVPERRTADLRECVRRVARLVERLIGEDVRLEVQVCEEAAWARVDVTQIEQALVNLAVNARDAMPFGGKLRLAIDLARLSTAQAAELDLPEGVYARLSVIDEGTGIPEEIRDRIFEPFFTTKEAGKGTGLGLSMVFGTLRQNDGAVAYDTSVGQGSRFFLYLPVVAPDAQAAAPAPTARPSTGSERIWLVEDQPHLRSMIERALRSLGYRVASFPSGDELLAALPDLEPAQVLMTDVVLPGIDGVQLARRVRAILGDIRILVSSGYDADAMRDWHPEPGWRFLAKPFAVGALARALRSVLDQP